MSLCHAHGTEEEKKSASVFASITDGIQKEVEKKSKLDVRINRWLRF